MKNLRLFVAVLLLVIGVNALVSGYLLMRDPSGEALGMSVDLLRHSPFRDFRIPGIALFVLIGLLQTGASATVVLRATYYSEIVILQGMLLTTWIVVQLILIQEVHPLHWVLGAAGLVLFFSGIRLRNDTDI